MAVRPPWSYLPVSVVLRYPECQLEAATAKGVTIVADNLQDRSRGYNLGEQELADAQKGDHRDRALRDFEQYVAVLEEKGESSEQRQATVTQAAPAQRQLRWRCSEELLPGFLRIGQRRRRWRVQQVQHAKRASGPLHVRGRVAGHHSDPPRHPR